MREQAATLLYLPLKKAASSRQGIVAALVKRVTLQDPFDRKIAAFKGSIFLKRLQGVFAAGRVETTARRLQRGNKSSIESNETDQ